MRDQTGVASNHPYRAYTEAQEAAQLAQAHAQATRVALLTQDRGRVVSVSWTTSSENADDGTTFTLPCDMTLTIEGTEEVLSFGDVAEFDLLDSEDWAGAYFGSDPLAELIEEAQLDGEDTEDWRAAATKVLASLTGIDASRVEAYCWLLHQHVWASYQQGDATLVLAPSSPPH